MQQGRMEPFDGLQGYLVSGLWMALAVGLTGLTALTFAALMVA